MGLRRCGCCLELPSSVFRGGRVGGRSKASKEGVVAVSESTLRREQVDPDEGKKSSGHPIRARVKDVRARDGDNPVVAPRRGCPHAPDTDWVLNRIPRAVDKGGGEVARESWLRHSTGWQRTQCPNEVPHKDCKRPRHSECLVNQMYSVVSIYLGWYQQASWCQALHAHAPRPVSTPGCGPIQ